MPPITLANVTTGKNIKPPRIVLIGVEKIGKSTFGADSPNPIFIQVKGETGLDMIEAPKFAVCSSYEQVLECVAALCNEKHDRKTLCIDSMSTLNPLMIDYACRQENVKSVSKLGGGYGAQEDVLVKHAGELMEAMDFLRDEKGMSCVLIAHIKPNPKTFNDPETDPYDTYKVEMRDSIASAFFRWADAILFATFKKYTKETEGRGKKAVRAIGAGERVLYTEKRPAFHAGNRYGLPFELKFSQAEFAKALADRVASPAAKEVVPTQ